MTATPNLALPLIAAAQAQKHVTHNEALALLDALVQASVAQAGRIEPPQDPQEGERHLVGAPAGGAFAGHENALAFFDAGVWRFMAPRLGWRVYVESEDRMLLFDGTAWRELGGPPGALHNLDFLGIGTVADAQNPLSAKLNKALFTARTTAESGDGDMRYTLNKEASANVLTLLMQSGFSGRAELGLAGDDDFRLKVSPDGAAWLDALVVDRATGNVRRPAMAAFEAGAPAGMVVVDAGGQPLAFPNVFHDGGSAFDEATARLIAPAAGCYLVLASIAVAAVSGTPHIAFGRNGDAEFETALHAPGPVALMRLMQLGVGDEVGVMAGAIAPGASFTYEAGASLFSAAFLG